MYLVEVDVQGQEQKGFLKSVTSLVTTCRSVIRLYFDLGISCTTPQMTAVNSTVIAKNNNICRQHQNKSIFSLFECWEIGVDGNAAEVVDKRKVF